MNLDQVEKVQRAAIESLTKNGTVKYTFAAYDASVAQISNFLIHDALARENLLFLHNIVLILLRECIANAVKANLKRAYFKQKGADIENGENYQQLMQTFKEDAVNNLPDYLDTIKQMGLKVGLIVQKKADHLRFVIVNNTPITTDELDRVKDRIQLVKGASSLPEVLGDLSDDTEGAGLGLAMNLMMLKTSGIGVDNFCFDSNETLTQATLKIPLQLNRPESISAIVDKIYKKVHTLPSFPAIVQEIIEMCDNPEIELIQIARKIEQDPSLSAGILKLVNSARYASFQNGITSLQKAASILGTKMIKQMAIVHSAKNILEDHQKIFDDFWTHSYQCAFYCRAIAAQLGHRAMADSLFLAGLLHDLGHIILHSVDPKTIEEINGLQVSRSGVSAPVLEEISLGISHNEIGAQLASRWKFPEELVSSIRSHHYPETSDHKNRVFVSIVHIADGLINLERGSGRYVHFDWNARTTLGLDNKGKLEELHEKVKNEFAQARAS